MTEPAPLPARAIGSYSKGCLAGGVSLPINGPDWQVMRLSRNRNWGSPQLIDYLERLASDARAFDGWPGLLVGDMSQPRGGPMLTGHTSHQVGLDADIWLTPMPDHILTREEREDMSAVSMLKDPFHRGSREVHADAGQAHQAGRVLPASGPHLRPPGDQEGALPAGGAPWARTRRGSPRCGRGGTTTIISTSASPARPAWTGCENQKPVTGDDGCGKELDNWYAMLKKSAIWQAQQPPIKPEHQAATEEEADPAQRFAA